MLSYRAYYETRNAGKQNVRDCLWCDDLGGFLIAYTEYSYIKQNLDIRGWLYRVECLSVSTIPSRLYKVEYFYCSKQVMLSRLFLLLRSSRQEVFCKKKSQACNCIKKETLWHTEHLWWLILAIPIQVHIIYIHTHTIYIYTLQNYTIHLV